MAGELGFEPRSSVLETDSLTVELTPPGSVIQPSFQIRTGSCRLKAVLLRLFVVRVLAAGITELRELKPASGRLLVFRRRVIPVLALGALQCNNFAHLSILTDFAENHASTAKIPLFE